MINCQIVIANISVIMFLLVQLMTDVVGNPEEERRAEFYNQPWSQEAVSRYFYCKVSGNDTRERYKNAI